MWASLCDIYSPDSEVASTENIDTYKDDDTNQDNTNTYLEETSI